MHLDNRYPLRFPPPFADAWGDDRFGLWADWRIGESDVLVQRMRWIEPGSFLMGSPESEPERSDNEGPQHLVTLTKGFWLADTACTQDLWAVIMENNPRGFSGDGRRPVVQVSWDDVQEFLLRIQKLLPEGCEAVLPTEAEWEYACRAGTTTPFSFGEQIDTTIVNFHGELPYADGAKGIFRKRAVPVKSLPSNPWGLYEMHGNVLEWCADPLRPYSAEPQIDPRGQDEVGAQRAPRGGSWYGGAMWARSAFRGAEEPGYRLRGLGFRFALRSQEPGALSP